MEGRLKDQGLQALLKELSRSNNGLCVITTRVEVKDIEQTVDKTTNRVLLDDLSDDAGMKLLRSLGVKKGTDKERTIKSYITTIAKDRDGEAVMSEGAIMDDYNLLKIVLFGHQYGQLGVGKNLWIIPNNNHSTEGVFGLIALTKYATKKANPFADQVYNWRMEDMPMGESIGFIPVEYFTPDDKQWSKLFDGWVKRVTAYMKSKTRDITDDLFADLKRIYTKWIMLEYSDVMVPSNAHAVTLAISKGLLTESEVERYTIKSMDTEDPVSDPDKTKPLTIQDVEKLLGAALSKVNNQTNDLVEPEAVIPEAKEGRRFSAKTLAAIETAYQAGVVLTDALDDLLDVTEPETDDIDIESIAVTPKAITPGLTQDDIDKIVADALDEPDTDIDITDIPPQIKARLRRGETL